MDKAPRDYSFIAPMYDRIFNLPLSEGHREIGRLLKSHARKKSLKVLEVGVGSGLTLAHLPAAVDFTGIDNNERMLEMAQSKVIPRKGRRIVLRKMDAHRLGFRSSSFDLVLAPSVLSALEFPLTGMKELVRVARPGGKIAVIANMRTGTLLSNIVKLADPFTRRYLGYRMDLSLETFMEFKGLRLLEKKRVNNLLGMGLSWYLLFEKR